MLSDNEILRRLRAIRFSPRSERLARRATSMRGIALEAGIAREHIHKVASGKYPLRAPTKAALSAVLERVIV
jgi:DNA-binding phage protein